MANWCCGDLKIRGCVDNVKSYLEYSLYQGGQVIKNKYGDLELIKAVGHLKDTDRCFIPEAYTQDFVANNNGIITVVIPTEHAWGPVVKNFQLLSQKFNVDFRFYGYERGMEFNCEFEVIAGKITISREIKFSDYQWECPHPLIGG